MAENVRSVSGAGRSVTVEELIGGSFGGAREQLTAAQAQAAALFYISLGWAVTAGPGVGPDGFCACKASSRCGNAGKHAYAGWGNKERRTLTAEQAERYWSPSNKLWLDRPVDTVFIVPYLSGLIVADVDSEDKWAELGMPDTLWEKSGSGRGGHRLYKYEWGQAEDPMAVAPILPGKLPGGAGELKFRGIIAAAPSVHRAGGRYEWDNWSEWADKLSVGGRGGNLPEVPATLLEAGSRGGSAGVAESLGKEWDDVITEARKEGLVGWIKLMFEADLGDLRGASRATSARPLVLFAAAARFAKWVEAGIVSEQFVVDTLIWAAGVNGALDRYSESDLVRQIKNGLAAGVDERRM